MSAWFSLTGILCRLCDRLVDGFLAAGVVQDRFVIPLSLMASLAGVHLGVPLADDGEFLDY